MDMYASLKTSPNTLRTLASGVEQPQSASGVEDVFRLNVTTKLRELLNSNEKRRRFTCGTIVILGTALIACACGVMSQYRRIDIPADVAVDLHPALDEAAEASKARPFADDQWSFTAPTPEGARFDEATITDHAFEAARLGNTLPLLPLVVVASSYGWPPKNSLEWINAQPWPAFVSTKEPGRGINSEPWGNAGREAGSYLHFILQFYSSLPERVVFVHGHDMAWHQQGYQMQYLLRNLCLDTGHTYLSLNAHPATSEGRWAVNNLLRRKSPFSRMFQERFGMSLNQSDRFYDRCCSQFVVHRSAVLRHPRATYQEMADVLFNESASDSKYDQHLLEEAWHHIFGVQRILQAERYGAALDSNVESGAPLIFSEQNSLARVAACPHPGLCNQTAGCREAVRRAKEQPVTYVVPRWWKRDKRYKELFKQAKQRENRGFAIVPIS